LCKSVINREEKLRKGKGKEWKKEDLIRKRVGIIDKSAHLIKGNSAHWNARKERERGYTYQIIKYSEIKKSQKRQYFFVIPLIQVGIINR